MPQSPDHASASQSSPAPFIPKSLASPPGVQKSLQDAALFKKLAPAMLTVFLCVALGFSVMPLRNAIKKPRDNKDYTTWYDTGKVVRDGEGGEGGGVLYPTDIPFPYMYPPLGAVCVFAPLSTLGYLGMAAALVLINTAAWLACILLSVRLATGNYFREHPLLYILPFACTLPFVWDTYFLGQVNIVLLALMLGAFNLLIVRKSDASTSPLRKQRTQLTPLSPSAALQAEGLTVSSRGSSESSSATPGNTTKNASDPEGVIVAHNTHHTETLPPQLPSPSHQISAGTLIALAAATKAFPILALPYLIWRRHWTALAALLIALTLFMLLPGVYRGYHQNLADIQTWTSGMLFEQSSNPNEQLIGQRGTVAFEFNNQSLLSITHRFTRPILAGNGDGNPFHINLLSLSESQTEKLFYSLAFLVGGIYLLLMPRKRNLTPLAAAMEMSMLTILIILFTPLAWTYYFCWLMPAFAVAFQFISREGLQSPLGKRALLYTLIPILILLSALTQNFNQTLQAIGVTAWGAVALFCVLGWMLKKTASSS